MKKTSKKVVKVVEVKVVNKVESELKIIRGFYDAAKNKEAGKKGFDGAVDKVIFDLFDSKKLTTPLSITAGTTVRDGAQTLVEISSEFGNRFTARAFQLGVVQILMKHHLTEFKGKRKSLTKFKKWRDSIIDPYVKNKLGLPADRPLPTDPPELKEKCDKLQNSKLRQLEKYVNLAECSDRILDYAYGGIDAALEVRWLLIDLINLLLQESSGTKKRQVKLTPELAQTSLNKIEEQYPSPTKEELAGKNAAKEIRLWADSIATLFRLRNAGIDEKFMDYKMAHEYASAIKKSILPNIAAQAFNAVKDVPEVNRKKKLGKFLNDAVEVDDPAVVNMAPARIGDFVAKILRWSEAVSLDDAAMTEICNLQSIKDSISTVYEVIRKINESVNTNIAQIEERG